MFNNSITNRIPSYKIEGKKEIKVFNLADVHYGNVACDKKFFKEVVNYIKKEDNVYWVSTGDMLEINSPKGTFYDSKGMPIDQEFNSLVDILSPIANKCFGFTGSNHSHRVVKLGGFSIDSIAAKVINLPYLGGLGTIGINLSVSNSPISSNYYLTFTHGNSNGATMGSKINSVMKLYDLMPDSDLFLEGHTHNYISTKKEINYIDKRNNKLKTREITFCIAGHCLEWSKSYASDNKYSPSPIGFPMFTLKQNKKDIVTEFITPNNIK